MKTQQIKFLFGMLIPIMSRACHVSMDGEDKTTEFFVVDEVTGEAYVDCIGRSKCRNAIITGCPIVKCGGSEACNEAQIVDFSEKVICEGIHACHRTEMTSAVEAAVVRVDCIGSLACDVAKISGENLGLVECKGAKACRKVHIEGASLVKCHDGSQRTDACEDLATMHTECLYCGYRGCSEYINMCRYKIIGDNVSDSDRDYATCKPEELVGNCPDGLQAELELELSGREEIGAEGGSRRLKGLRA
eukprot:jgi/Psemu1/293399/fgenesh1_pg.2285_\